MTAGVITVGGKKYAVGLYWQVSDSSNTARAARAAANQPGAPADFFCVRPGNNKGRAPQFGLGEGKLGHKWNMPTAAGTLANRQPGSWVGVFNIPEGVWYVEVRDDLIAPEGDQLFADEAAAMTRLQDASAQGGLEKIYAPASWAIPGAEASSLPSLLSGRADVRLQPVKLPKKLIFGLLGGAAVLGVVFFGANFIMSAREEARIIEQRENAARMEAMRRQQEEEQRRRDEEERQRQLQQQAMQLPTYQRVWEQAPKPVDWLLACRDAMDKVQMTPLGWSLGSVTCASGEVNASWSRTSGPAVVPKDAVVEPSLRSATVHYSLAEMKPRGEEKLWPADAIMLYILYNDWKADLNYMADETPPPLPSGEKVPPPPWLKRQLRWTVPLSPWNLRGPLVDLPGLVLNSLVWSRDGNWQMEGVLYEQRK